MPISHAEVESALLAAPEGAIATLYGCLATRVDSRSWTIDGSRPLFLLPAIDRLMRRRQPLTEGLTDVDVRETPAAPLASPSVAVAESPYRLPRRRAEQSASAAPRRETAPGGKWELTAQGRQEALPPKEDAPV